MKRSGPLRRTTALKAGAPLKRAPLRTKVGPKPTVKEIAAKRAERAARDAERDLIPIEFTPSIRRAVAKRSRGWCEMPNCTRHAAQHHHRKMKSAGGRGQEWNCLHLCVECHDWVHANTGVSYRHGALIRRSRDDDPGLHFHPGWRTCQERHDLPGVDSTPPDAATLRPI